MVQTALWPDEDNHDDYETSLEGNGCPHLECAGSTDCECDDCDCSDGDCENCGCEKEEEWDCQP